ncbi:7086_t:CDS:2 [Entrophospora sp. SA101]|nr:7086_t:CDS:2 [Entrophospora sp. SA101]
MTNYENTRWKCRLIYFQENKSWNLLEFLQWSIVYANDFNEKQDEHLLYKICLEKLSINPQLIETNDSNESIIIRQLALQCLETFEKESKLFNVKAFWKNSSTVMKTLGKASDMNSKNIIHQMLDIHYDFKNKSWNLLEFLQWSIVYANDFNEKQDEHLLYKICLEKLSINPQLIETNDSNESIIIRQLALQCLETFEV